MKNYLLSFLLIILFASSNYSQNVSINNGNVLVRVEQYGALRYSTINGSDTLIQIDRASVLVGGSENQVFDYYNDAENVEPASMANSSEVADYEASVVIDNSYSGLPPAVQVKVNAYLWNDAKYVIFKFTVTNKESGNASFIGGMEILPQISNEYGFEKVDMNDGTSDFIIYKDDADYVGIKVLNNPLNSLKTIEWFDGYNGSDNDLWSWLTYNGFDNNYESGADGVVSFISQAAQELATDGSFEMYIAFASGNTKDDAESNMDLAVAQYENIATSVDDQLNQLPVKFTLEQNYPNPFNPSTSIQYSVPSNENVNLKVYDILGNEVAELVNQNQPAGNYQIKFDASNLTSGIYFYTIKAGSFVQTKKMMLVK